MQADLVTLLSKSKRVLLKDFSGASFAQILSHIFLTTDRPVLIIVGDQKRAESLKDEIAFFSGSDHVEILPSFDVRPYYGLSPHRDVLLQTVKIYHKLLSGEIDFLIAPKMAVLRRLLPKDVFASLSIRLVKNDLLDRDEFLKNLTMMGYERYAVVEEPGQFAVRGDIIDVFSPQYDEPVRVSLFDIEIEEMKFFSPASQRTKGSVSQVSVVPVHEIFLNFYSVKADGIGNGNGHGDVKMPINVDWKSDLKRRADRREIQKNKRDQIEEFVANRIYFHGIEFFLPLFYERLGSVFEYLPRQTVVVCDLDNELAVAAATNLEELNEHLRESGHIETIFAPDEIFLTAADVRWHLDRFTTVFHEWAGSDDVPVVTGGTESNLVLKSKIASQVSKIHSLAPLASELNQKRLEGFCCFIVCQNAVQLDRVRDLLERFELPLRVVSEDVKKDVLSHSLRHADSDRLICLMVGSLHEGFLSPQNRQWWLTDEEIFGKKTKRAVRKKGQTAVFSSFSEISEGDFIIHMDHGIGIYRGLTRLDYDENQNDLLLLEYLGGDKLYVPVDKLNRVQRFVAEEGVTPQLDKLGGRTWIKTRTKAKRAARKMARELLELQAKRAELKGHGFAANSEMMEEFAAGFAFEETPDQLVAIEEVLGDMEKERPMDRLVCGDVGYGKTEVAMRAAFKAVADNRQVAVLVPTTVLAFQHYTTFYERFRNYPVTVALLSRFRSSKEQAAVVRGLKEGKVDVVVGTHRLLSRDIRFRNLGLLVIDEEHRFGVSQKEHIKKLKSLVDVVTLTATPIPRTLNFALNGIRDISVINTPPVDRLAVKTYSCYFDDVTIRDAILKELRRGGQVFFVHNRVQSIQKMTARLKNLVPEARIQFAHGQMAESELEEVMIDFMNHEFDVLVCTTIIESGLDIPNANTIIINRADTYGLAQLYQLRGRVGRSFHQAYCYLIVPEQHLITRKAQKRLAAIQKFTELGSGFKVASRDLEIRGAGNILGREQSGHIAAVGYDMYVHLLNEAIAELKHKHIPPDFEPEIQLNLAARIPDDFIADEQLRLILYKQVSACESLDEVGEVRVEWEDRFGKIPGEVENLFALIRIKILCKEILLASLKQSGDTLLFGFHPDHRVDTAVLAAAIQKNPKKFAMTRDGQFAVRQRFASAGELTAYVLDLLEKMRASATKIP